MTAASLRTSFGGGTGGSSNALSARSTGSTTNETDVLGNTTTGVVAGNRGSCVSDKLSGDSEPQSQRAMLNSTFGAFETAERAGAFDRQSFITGELSVCFLAEQHVDTAFGFEPRAQQHVPDSRLAIEQWQLWLGFRAHVDPPNRDKFDGKPIAVSANHSAHSKRAVRQLRVWRRNDRMADVNRRQQRMTDLMGTSDTAMIRSRRLNTTQMPPVDRGPRWSLVILRLFELFDG